MSLLKAMAGDALPRLPSILSGYLNYFLKSSLKFNLTETGLSLSIQAKNGF